MKKSRKHLMLLLLFLLVFSPAYSDGYYSAEEIDPLLTELENNLNELEKSNQEKEKLLNEKENSINQIESELKTAKELLKKSEAENTTNIIITGTACYLLGIFTTFIAVVLIII